MFDPQTEIHPISLSQSLKKFKAIQFKIISALRKRVIKTKTEKKVEETLSENQKKDTLNIQMSLS